MGRPPPGRLRPSTPAPALRRQPAGGRRLLLPSLPLPAILGRSPPASFIPGGRRGARAVPRARSYRDRQQQAHLLRRGPQPPADLLRLRGPEPAFDAASGLGAQPLLLLLLHPAPPPPPPLLLPHAPCRAHPRRYHRERQAGGDQPRGGAGPGAGGGRRAGGPGCSSGWWRVHGDLLAAQRAQQLRPPARRCGLGRYSRCYGQPQLTAADNQPAPAGEWAGGFRV